MAEFLNAHPLPPSFSCFFYGTVSAISLGQGHFALLSVRVLIWLDLLRPDSFPGAVTHAMDLRNGNHPILRVKKSAVRRPHFQVCCLACFTCLFLRDVTCNRF